MTIPIKDLKELLADPKNRIKLDDAVSAEIRTFLLATATEHFPVQEPAPTTEALVERLKAYEAAAANLQRIVILLARWGDSDALLVLEKVFARIAGAERALGGLRLWINLAWYPLILLMYSAGVASLSAKRFEALRIVLTTESHVPGDDRESLVVSVTRRLTDTNEAWKSLPGFERHHTPRSDYLFALLGPPLDELLFLGGAYEELFEGFEIYNALAFAYTTKGDWGPIGRFAWKNNLDNRFDRLIGDAGKEGTSWPPLRAGLFGGSPDEFVKTAEAVHKRLKGVFWG